jgi:hypothetical protein
MERGKSTLTLTAKDLGRADSFGVVASTNDGTFWGSDEYFSKDNFWHQSGDHFAWFRDEAPTPNPEPGTLALLGSGLIGVAGVVRRKLNR